MRQRVFWVVSFVVWFNLGFAAPQGRRSGTTEENKKLAQRYFEDVLNKGKLAVADEIFAAGLIVHPPGSGEDLRGLENFKQFVRSFRQAFPDVRFVEEAVLADGDRVAAQVQFFGTHTGREWAGVPPKGKRVSVRAVDVFRITDGKIQEVWIYLDTGSYLAQLRGSALP